jgi:hypothetical protein
MRLSNRLHDSAAAATGAFMLFYIELMATISIAITVLGAHAPSTFHLLVEASNIANNTGKCFIHVNALFCWRFNESATEISGKITTLCMKEEMREVSIVKSIYSKATADARTLTGDLTIMLQITLVRYQNHWEEIGWWCCILEGSLLRFSYIVHAWH